MALISTSFGELYVRAFGDRKASCPVVFLHALGTDHRIWSDVIEALPRGCGTFVLDLPGHGLSPLASEELDVLHVGRHIVSTIEALGLDSVVLVGLSVGGQLALAAAHQAPSLVKGLVLCNTGPVIGTPQRWAQRIQQVQRDGLGSIADQTLDIWLHEGDRLLRAELRALLLSTPPAGYLAMSGLLQRADLREILPGLRMPTLCLSSTHDVSTPPAMLREMARALPNAHFVELPDTAHLPTAQTPQRVARCIANHVQSLSPSEAYDKGLQVRRAILGAYHVERATAGSTAFDEGFQTFITEGAWGRVWARMNLSRRERSMLTIALLAAGGNLDEVEMHVRAASNAGASPEDISEALLHVAVYAGVPAANSAIQRAKAVYRAQREIE